MGGISTIVRYSVDSANLKPMLQRQLGFLERSCSLYDAGHTEESLRIAVTLRVLFHDTARSISLLTQMGIKDTARVLTTFTPGYSEDTRTGMIWVNIPMMASVSGERVPPLDNTDRKENLSVKDWWEEIIMCMNHKTRRRDVVLSAANQDGGAHVDTNPSGQTKALIEGIGTLTTIKGGKLIKTNLINQHYPLLRQFAFEVLNSRHLTSS